MVPLPDTAIDFSDLRSQSSRMNERVSHSSTCLLDNYPIISLLSQVSSTLIEKYLKKINISNNFKWLELEVDVDTFKFSFTNEIFPPVDYLVFAGEAKRASLW